MLGTSYDNPAIPSPIAYVIRIEKERSDNMHHVVGISMPRSGHHYLERLLRGYFGPRMGYCEFYTPPDCCKQVPCSRAAARAAELDLFYQKNHDHALDLQLDERRVSCLLIQYRHPVYRSASNFPLECQDRPYLDTEAHLQYWLALEADYYVRFWKKWITPSPDAGTRVLLQYESLLRDPFEALTRVMKALDMIVDVPKLGRVIERNSRRGNEGKNFRPRTLDSIPDRHKPHFAAMEDIIFASGLELPYTPLLRDRVEEAHPIHDIYRGIGLERAGNPVEALSAFERALDKGARAPRLLLRVAALYRVLGDKKRRKALLEEALAETPDDPMVRRQAENAGVALP